MIWEVVDELVEKRRIITVEEVVDELKKGKGGGQLHNWVKNNVFSVKPNRIQVKYVKGILSQFADFVKWPLKLHKVSPPLDADPFIVALGVSLKRVGWSIVSEEDHKENRVDIPYVAQQFDVRCIRFSEFLSDQNLRIQHVIPSNT